MTIFAVLKCLRERGVAFALVDGKVAYKGPSSVLTPGALELLRGRKQEIAAALAHEAEQAVVIARCRGGVVQLLGDVGAVPKASSPGELMQ